MDDDFNPDDLRPVPWVPDTEVTLGWGSLVGMGLCLVTLCGLCFWQGYAMGHRSLQRDAQAASQQANQKTTTPATAAASKPSAMPQNSVKPKTAPDSAPAATSYVGASTVQAAVKPALPPAATAPTLMVQVAAVSHQEDADVLAGALRKRGYAVNVNKDRADGLLHVRLGPFINRDEANAARQKLLGEGYNASVQP